MRAIRSSGQSAGNYGTNAQQRGMAEIALGENIPENLHYR
jgi:hypothetical protein